MRAWARTSATLRAGVIALLAGLLVLAEPTGHPAGLADSRIEEAEERTAQQQAELDGLLAEIEEIRAEADRLHTELAELESAEASHTQRSRRASASVKDHIRRSFKQGSADPLLTFVGAEDPAAATERARLLSLLANRSRQEAELAIAARQRTGADAERIAALVDEIEETETELAEREDEARELLAEAEEAEAEVREEVRRERERRRAQQRREQEAEERRLAQARASRSGDRSEATAASGGADANAAGGIACPVGQPRSYSDTYGAPRSGGRAHEGTDILAPRGTPIYAYEDGTIARTSNNRLGGVTLYLRGDSGNVYYYAHLQGYAGGISTGQRVRAGQQIATNGDSGNATGIPHLHIEVSPGGGGNVNPYPLIRRACG